jgi:hypothetical protein
MDIEPLQDVLAEKAGDWNLNGNFGRIIIVDSNLDGEEDMEELLLELCDSGY